MGLLDKLTSQGQGSNLSQYEGASPNKYGVLPGNNSKLHLTYSLNGNPQMPNQIPPSQLDLDGQTPPQYLNNLPQ